MKKFSMLIASAIIVVLFLKLLGNYSDRFKEVDGYYKDGIGINLEKPTDTLKYKNALADVLHKHNYVESKADADFAAEQLTAMLKKNGTPTTLYDLKKRRWQIPADTIERLDSVKAPGYYKNLKLAQKTLGINVLDSLGSSVKDSVVDVSGFIPSIDKAEEPAKGKNKKAKAKDAKAQAPKDTTKAQAPKVLRGELVAKVTVNDTSSWLSEQLKRKIPCKDVVVRLTYHYLDAEQKPETEIVAYAKTDATGTAIFRGLDETLSYSVLPICKGYEYGSAKGVVGGEWLGDEEVPESGSLSVSRTFTQQEQKVRLFGNTTLRQMKEDHTVTVRTPQSFRHTLIIYLIAFFAAWWGLFLVFARKGKGHSQSFIAILMLLTGFCLLMMFSINDPLTDELYGVVMGQGIIVGVIFMGLLQFVDFTKLYQDRSKIKFDIPMEVLKWVFKPFRRKVLYLTDRLSNKRASTLSKCWALLLILLCLPFLLFDLLQITRFVAWANAKCNYPFQKLPKGSGYLLLALFLTALLWTPLGSEVGGMKVNLNIGIKFQPSEIAKYFIVIFMAAFFCFNADKIVRYSEKGNAALFGHKLKMLGGIIIGLGILMVLYMILGDMGPAMVLAFTFIILYSIIKSKIDLSGAGEKTQLARILISDLAVLVYGIVSFLLCLYIGYRMGHMGLFCIGWFAAWIGIGIARKQIFESAIFFNFIIAAFIFGGTLLSGISPKVAHRLDSRNEMCTNTWGTLPLDGVEADAGENTQVAEGLWGLATGGFWGQGLGNGSPYFIPAFHTDMILESIGEQLGFVAILAIVLLLALLLYKTILAGYKSAHPFAFYCCLGIAIVTAVQFIIISLGSMGIIPLTGVTVPFFSYGRVSMILNLTAYGIVLSILCHSIAKRADGENAVEKLKRENIGKYSYSVSVLSWMYSILAVVILCSFFYYQVMARDEILIRPVYVNNVSGIPVVEYNPRIDQLSSKMRIGNVYDRNGVLLATSNSQELLKDSALYREIIGADMLCDPTKIQRRYYPFGNHLFFMLGDYNNLLFFESNSRRGYMAEARFMSDLRGYDNRVYEQDAQGKSVEKKFLLTSENYTPGKFFSDTTYTSEVKLKDYSALLPYLKAGLNNSKVTEVNNNEGLWGKLNSVEPKDVQLTIDAQLQTRLQNSIKSYMEESYNNPTYNKVRVSVVILDAAKGDLLASANYPLPDYDRLREESDSYSDNNKEADWKAYTDMDLGTTYYTAPGSTAKVMTSIAALQKDPSFANEKYNIKYKEIIYTRGEPYEGDKWGHKDINMSDALRYSSNCYFIKLVNDKGLYSELADVYGNVGIRIDPIAKEVTPKISYIYSYEKPEADWKQYVTEVEERCMKAYDKYEESGKPSVMNSSGKPGEWSWAWGQRGVDATPLAMARVASIPINGGYMPVTRYLLDEDTMQIKMISTTEAETMVKYMKRTSREHDKFNVGNGYQGDLIGGKTGTPVRDIYNVKSKKVTYNDGWYICFIEDAQIKRKENNVEKVDKSPIAIAVRMERIKDATSTKVTNYMKAEKHGVLAILQDLGYIKIKETKTNK